MTSQRGVVRITAYWGFIVLGVGNTLLGPALQSVLRTYAISPSSTGSLFLAGTIGYLIAVLFGGPAGDQWGRRAALLLGSSIYMIGMIGFAFAPSWLLAVLASGIAGIGGGVLDSGTNALANDIASPEGHAMEQILLHTFFGLGALLGPLLIGGFLALGAGWRPAFVLVGAGALVLCVLLTRLSLAARATSAPAITMRSVATLAANPRLLLMGLMLSAYVGAELLVSDWGATYLQQVHHLDTVRAATSVGFFWAGLVFGRLGSALLVRWFSGLSMLIASCGFSMVAAVLLVTAPNTPVALGALLACGLAYAAIFPLIMAVAGELFPEATGSAAGLLIAGASLIGTAIPWIGGILVQYADPRAALSLTIPASVVMILVALLLRARYEVRVPVPTPAWSPE